MKQVMKTLGAIGAFAFGVYEVYDTFSGNDYGDKLDFSPLELYYTDEVPEEKAQALGQYLEESNFSNGEAMSVQLDKKDERYFFNMIVLDGVANNDKYINLFRSTLSDLKSNVFMDDPLTLNLTDATFDVLQAIPYDPAFANPYGDMLEFNATEVYFKDVSEQEANALGNYLIESEFAEGTPKAVQLITDNDAYIFKLIVDSTRLTDQEYLDIVSNYASALSQDVFENKPVVIHLADDYFNTILAVQ